MKKHYYYYLLIISLLFNLAFISMFTFRIVQMRRIGFPPPPNNHEVKMNKTFRKNFRPEMGGDRLKNFELRRNFFAALSEKEPDYKRIKSLGDSLISSQHLIEEKITQHFIESRTQMDYQEAKDFFGSLTDHADRGCMREKNKENRRKK